MFRRKFLMAAIVAGIATLAGPARSEADFKLRVDFGNNGSFESTVADGDPLDVNLLPGFITVVSSNGIMVTVNTGTSNHAFGTLDLNNLTVSGAGTVAIELTDTGYSSFSGYSLSVGGTTSENPAILAFQAGGLTSNTEFDLTTSTGVLAGVDGPGASFSAVGEFGSVAAVDPYSLTIRAVVTHDSASDTTSFDAFLQPVPAPAGLILAATALPFVGLLRRRLRKPEATTAA
jgi:hypothetical protein